MWCSGNMRAFQALVTGSIPVTRSEELETFPPKVPLIWNQPPLDIRGGSASYSITNCQYTGCSAHIAYR
ncbi:hypothetical protein SSM2_176 [Synechococcus phage S-SM2]|uniref:Uncharacterized protein n=1 Tax=Synechococcus phage S-SM2 TaxID=444860 RepID=E3SJ68_9CAUD|nr:hypothetical protein SSM2_176 [Synechococcus phage S-SM2]ADO97516.1 hypothetical protein SSM2_176 [Synechococcus phage S-SM2]